MGEDRQPGDEEGGGLWETQRKTAECGRNAEGGPSMTETKLRLNNELFIS